MKYYSFGIYQDLCLLFVYLACFQILPVYLPLLIPPQRGERKKKVWSAILFRNSMQVGLSFVAQRSSLMRKTPLAPRVRYEQNVTHRCLLLYLVPTVFNYEYRLIDFLESFT